MRKRVKREGSIRIMGENNGDAAVASIAAPPARKEGSQENSDGVGVGGTDDAAEGEDEEEVRPKVSRTAKMTPRGGRHEPYEKKEGEFITAVLCYRS